MWIAVVSRWIHVLFAIALVGGAIFQLVAAHPAIEELADDQRQALRERIMGRWRKWVFMGIGLLLVSGFYNYLAVTAPAHKGDGVYHMLMGIKILLALGVFFLASALAGRSAGLASFRRDAGKWLRWLVALAVVIVAIAGFLKFESAPPARTTQLNAMVTSPYVIS